MPPDIPRILQTAEGYLELGMLDHAALELEHLEPEARTRGDVLTIRCRLFMAAQQWEAMRDVARHLVSMNTMNVQHWIWAAWATRRAENISAARVILQKAKAAHPDDPMIDYNLACYSCQLGEIEEARILLKNAIMANEAFKMMALKDPDLEPLW
jgi:lipopolysaccharide biosynthesis regulator YciM